MQEQAAASANASNPYFCGSRDDIYYFRDPSTEKPPLPLPPSRYKPKIDRVTSSEVDFRLSEDDESESKFMSSNQASPLLDSNQASPLLDVDCDTGVKRCTVHETIPYDLQFQLENGILSELQLTELYCSSDEINCDDFEQDEQNKTTQDTMAQDLAPSSSTTTDQTKSNSKKEEDRDSPEYSND